MNIVDEDTCEILNVWRLKRNKILEIMKGLWFLLHSKWMSQTPSKKTTYSFNHCFRLCHFPVPWKEAEIATPLIPGKYPTFPKTYFCSASFAHCRQNFREADFKNNRKAHWGKKYAKCKSVRFLSTSQHYTSMYEAGGSCHSKYNQ
jgi:hypothetical protein